MVAQSSPQSANGRRDDDAFGDVVYGLGRLWSIGGEVYFGHDGRDRDLPIMLAHKDAGVGAVVMTNGDNGTGLICNPANH
jgi:hypothetical protein